MKKKLSVIIGVYNPPLSAFKKCVESVINQVYRNLEIILLDDGSSNGAEILCDEYAQIDDRIIVKHQRNYGTLAKFEIGYSLATGDYLTNVDHDDYLEPEYYKRLMEIANTTPSPDVVDSGYIHHDYKTNKITAKNVDLFFRIDSENGIVQSVIEGKIATDSWCRIFKNGLQKQEKEWLLGDPLTFIHAQSLIHIPYAGYHFVNREGSAGQGRVNSWILEELEKFIVSENRNSTLEVYPFSKDYMNNTALYWLLRSIFSMEKTKKPYSAAEVNIISKIKKYAMYSKSLSQEFDWSGRQEIKYYVITHYFLRKIFEISLKLRKKHV